NLNKKIQAASRTIDFINQQLEGIRDSLRTAERQMQVFKDNNVMTDLSAEALRLYQKLEGFETQKTELVVKSNYYNYLQNYITEDENLDQIILPSSVGISDNILSGLISRMVDMQLEMKMQLSKDKLEHPLMAERRGRINEIRKDIIESVNNQKEVDKIQLEFLSKNIKAIEKQLSFIPSAERQYISIKRNYTLLENLYIFLLQKRAEAGISKASTTSDVSIVNPPRSGNYITPKPTLNYLIAISVGFALPLLVFLSFEFFNTKVQSREDIERVSTIPFLGGTGHKKGINNLEVVNHPKSAIAESFRALRSNLNYFVGSKENTVILITSSISGEGKTFTSINLASVFALSGKRTLIIGADMRKPKIFEDFALQNDKGLSSLLAGMNSFDEVVQRTNLENLFLISGGPIPPNPS
ncbi:MAG: capsular biosynthesis protein, partial [Cyclobacteriaceae bacterium]|nr:capsular biosynthesis protein [Cyclobacteriaceae bacterium]